MKEKMTSQNLRKEGELGMKYQFTIIRPGGNDTALVEGMQEDPKIRKKINDEIMRRYPSVEQVGFVNLDLERLELCMAGGEFCGNATRSTAWQALAGQEGDVKIRVSGVEGLLKAGVDAKGNAWAQMPVKYGFESVRELTATTSLVELDGITHVVTYDALPKNATKEVITELALDLLEQLGLTKSVPASGVMYVVSGKGQLKIEPVVWVRDIETLFYETACGSGTTAVGLQLAKKLQSNIEVEILQPSGLPIQISVVVGGGFEYAQISGPVSSLNKGLYVSK